MLSGIKPGNMLLSFIYYVIFISADRESEANHYPCKSPYCSLDDMTEILNHKFMTHDKAEYGINFDGTLNPLFGYLYRNSNLLANKRFFSYGIKLKASCDCMKNNDMSEDDPNTDWDVEDRTCYSHRLFPPEYDTAFELYEGQKTRRNNLELDYLYDYHNCLIGMFKSFDCRKIFRSLKNSFSYFMETLPVETAEKFLAVLFLLPENIYSVISSSAECTGQDHLKNRLYYCGVENTADERIVFHSDAFEFELRCNTEHEKLIIRSSIKSIISFFSECGTKYKKVVEGKREASRGHGNDATYLIETPEFLIQNYIYEYCKNSRDKHTRIVENLFRLLNEAGNDRLLRKYFTRLGSEDENAMKNRRHVEAALSSYKMEFHKLLSIYNILPLDFVRNRPEPGEFGMYNRSLDTAMDHRKLMNYAEEFTFFIMCVLFYDNKEQCFKLPAGVELRDKRLQQLFSNQAFIRYSDSSSSNNRTTINYGRPSGTYDSGVNGSVEFSMDDLNKIFGDLPDENIMYYCPEVYTERNKPDIKVRNELEDNIFNIAYVIAYMTGKTEYMHRINKLRNERAINGIIDWKERESVIAKFF